MAAAAGCRAIVAAARCCGLAAEAGCRTTGLLSPCTGANNKPLCRCSGSRVLCTGKSCKVTCNGSGSTVRHYASWSWVLCYGCSSRSLCYGGIISEALCVHGTPRCYAVVASARCPYGSNSCAPRTSGRGRVLRYANIRRVRGYGSSYKALKLGNSRRMLCFGCSSKVLRWGRNIRVTRYGTTAGCYATFVCWAPLVRRVLKILLRKWAALYHMIHWIPAM